MRLRQFLELYEAVMLAEATKYDNMFQGMISIDPKTKTNVDQMINWSRQNLQREDRIVWFLRWYRLLFLKIAMSWANPPDPRLVQLSQKYANDLSKVTGQTINPNDPIQMGGDALRSLQGSLSHFLSLPIQGIQSLQFTNQTPRDLFAQMTQLEDQWRQEAAENKQYLQSNQEGDQILMQFEDGWAWWLLDRGACSDEANAMGHCGNVPSERPGDRILSLRQQTAKGWRPSLTFILHGDGMLGEMKGRNNDKPQPQYHPYIIKLLENDIIKGITGGGYMPEHNFEMNDLPEEEQETLMNMKPALATAAFLFRKTGPTDEFGAKVVSEFAEKTGGMLEQSIEWDSQNKLFIVEKFKNVDALLVEHGSYFIQQVSAAFRGDNDMFMDLHYNPDNRAVEDLFGDLSPETQQAICLYAQQNYADNEDVEEDFDWSDPRDVFNLLEENQDDVIDTIRNAVSTGYQYGTENEAHKSFVSALEDGFTESNFIQVHYTMYADDKGKEHIQMDSPCSITISPQDAITILEDPDAIRDIAYSGWVESELELEEPRYGWSDYDERAAIDQAEDELSHLRPTQPQPVQPQPAVM